MKPYKGKKPLIDQLLKISAAICIITLLIAGFKLAASAGPPDVTMLAKLVYGEARGVESQTEQAAVIWCVLNRVDSEGYGMGKSIKHVVTFKNQFIGYSPKHPTVDDYGRDLKVLASDVLERWHRESQGETDVGRVLPKEYKWFCGKNGHNVFRDAYKRSEANTWNWTLESPYKEGST
jgi:hypothetical protein